MDKLLTASSPVEIEAKAGEAGLSPVEHDLARTLFHELTNRLGQVARLLEGADTSWPEHRFYFSDSGNAELAALLEELRGRPDFTEVASGVPSVPAGSAGLFACDQREGFTAVLVGQD